MRKVSHLHAEMGRILTKDPLWRGHRSFQEFPVRKVDSEWKSGRERFDWAIPDLRVVIEMHGVQHFLPQGFGEKDPLRVLDRFRQQVRLDRLKKEAAERAGWLHVTFRFDEEVTSERLMEKVLEGWASMKEGLEASDGIGDASQDLRRSGAHGKEKGEDRQDPASATCRRGPKPSRGRASKADPEHRARDLALGRQLRQERYRWMKERKDAKVRDPGDGVDSPLDDGGGSGS